MFAGVQDAGVREVDRLTVKTLGPDPRSAALLASAHLLGFDDLASIDIADVYFVAGVLDTRVRVQLTGVLVDPHLQAGSWGPPADPATGTVIEAALLPGVTDSVAATVIEVAETLGLGIDAAATGRRYVVHTSGGRSLDTDERERLATRLLSNAVIERVALGTIEPAFAHATTPSRVEHIEVRGLDDQALDALNRERGMALDPAELRAIADWFDKVGRAPTDVELETLAQTWSEHCAHKTFRARVDPAGRHRTSVAVVATA